MHAYGGFIVVDGDTRINQNLSRARILVKDHCREAPSKLEVVAVSITLWWKRIIWFSLLEAMATKRYPSKPLKKEKGCLKIEEDTDSCALVCV